jgi:hypothetical protein
MAKAPVPGRARKDEEAAESVATAQRILVIQLAWDDEPHRIAINNIPLDHRSAVRRETGMSLTSLIVGDIDIVSYAVLVWLSKRLHGLPGLSWQQFRQTWPDDATEVQVDVWAENPQGQRIDQDGNVVGEGAGEPDDPES